jgi:hypothetical protein
MAGLRTIRLAIMLFTRDLRLRDNPALDAAARRAQALVPLFVLDDRLVAAPLAAPNRVRLLLEALTDLRAALRERGGELIIRRGDPVTELIGLAAAPGRCPPASAAATPHRSWKPSPPDPRGTGPATFSGGIRLAAATRVEKMAAL